MRRENYAADFFFALRLAIIFLARGLAARPLDAMFCHAIVSALLSVV